MHEIEVKAVLIDKDAFIARLAERGCVLGPEIVQEDTVFVRETGPVETYLSNSEFLRLRTEDGRRTLFTFKYHPGRLTSLNASPLEYEVVIDSYDAMEKILLQMGYQVAVRIQKIRRKGTYQNWEVCIDEVSGLGCFVELEELAQSSDETTNIQKRMLAFLSEFGVSGDGEPYNRYDILLLQKGTPLP